MFTLSENPLDPAALAATMHDTRAGAFVAFEGWVRDHHDGRSVDALEYEAFPEMAVRTGEQILLDARSRFAILDARATHRIGRAGLGEHAIWVGVTANHRQEAFLACHWIMDRIKEDVPIWKKEHYTQGEANWVHASQGSRSVSADPATDPRYARQVVLAEVGAEGQRKLADAAVLVIGAGGLGCPALLYLAAAGVGRITLCDGDRVDETNLHRQVLFTAADIGCNKADAAADRLRAFHPGLAVRAIADAATPANLPGLLESHHAVLDCTDSFESKYAIHDAAFRAGIPLIQAAVYQFDGWVQLIDPRRANGCFRCLWPAPPPAGCVGNCAQAGVLGVTPGILGIHQATETLKLLLDLPGRLDDATLFVDVLNGTTRRLPRPRRSDCPCGGATPWPVDPGGLLFPGAHAEALCRTAIILDIREADERENAPAHILAMPHAPRDQWESIPRHFPERPLILACAGGIRARRCLELLGHPPGIFAWARGISDLPQSGVKTPPDNGLAS